MAGENTALGGLMGRDDWAEFALAGNMLANSIMSNYPNSGAAQMVAQQYEIARQNKVAMEQKEAARLAAKEQNRQKNRGIAGSVAGAALGGVAAPALGASAMSGISAGAGFGGGMATGDYASALQSFAQLQPLAPAAPVAANAQSAMLPPALQQASVYKNAPSTMYEDPYLASPWG